MRWLHLAAVTLGVLLLIGSLLLLGLHFSETGMDVASAQERESRQETTFNSLLIAR